MILEIKEKSGKKYGLWINGERYGRWYPGDLRELGFSDISGEQCHKPVTTVAHISRVSEDPLKARMVPTEK